MKHSPLYTAAALVLGCAIFRLLSGLYPAVVPNFSPLMAVTLVGAVYLPQRWSWVLGAVIFLITDLAFTPVNQLTDGSALSWFTPLCFVLFVLVGGLGAWIAERKSLVKIFAGTLASSLLFYIATNTFSWWHNITPNLPTLTAYPATLAGWWQANTTGMPGFAPTWTFLRNSLIGDLIFVPLLLLALDRDLLLGRSSERPAAQAQVS